MDETITLSTVIIVPLTPEIPLNEFNSTIGERVKGLTKKAYGWSKYGGSNFGLVQKTKTSEWYCQACHEKQLDIEACYMFEFLEGEFVRICAMCQYIKNTHTIGDFPALLKIVRANLDPLL